MLALIAIINLYMLEINKIIGVVYVISNCDNLRSNERGLVWTHDSVLDSNRYSLCIF